MSGWTPRRFWQSAQVRAEDGGFTIALDGRAVRTPAKTLLVVPTQALATEIAAEWDAQEKEIRPATMPFTRMANAALDKVTPQRAEVAAMLAAYGETDLLCYRAEAPEDLVQRQAAAWDPLLDWAEESYGARLMPCAGVMPVAQDPEALARLSEAVAALGPFELAGFHDLVALSGSLIIGLAAFRATHPLQELWEISRLDDLWQAEHWGDDEEASAQAALKHQAFVDAARFCELLRAG